MKKAAFRQPFFIFNSPFSIIFCTFAEIKNRKKFSINNYETYSY